MKTAIGIDPSPSSTGLVMLGNAGKEQPVLLAERCFKFPKLKGLDRAQAQCTAIMEFLSENPTDQIVVEGYSLNMKNKNSVVPVVEMGGLLRFCMKIDGHTWLDPRAGQVKLFATGNGNTPKDQIMMWVLKRWGHTSKNNDTADAYVAAAIGLGYMNELPQRTAFQLKVVGELASNCN